MVLEVPNLKVGHTREIHERFALLLSQHSCTPFSSAHGIVSVCVCVCLAVPTPPPAPQLVYGIESDSPEVHLKHWLLHSM